MLLHKNSVWLIAAAIFGCSNGVSNQSGETIPPYHRVLPDLDDIRLAEPNCIEVVGEALRDGLVKKDLMDYSLLKNPDSVVLQDTLVHCYMLPKLDSTAITLLDIDSIHAMANRSGDFMYLAFEKVEKVNDTTWDVALATRWMRADTSTVFYLSGGYNAYRYTKIGGVWRKELLYSVIS